MEKRNTNAGIQQQRAEEMLSRFEMGSAIILANGNKWRMMLEFDLLEEDGSLWCFTNDDFPESVSLALPYPVHIRCANIPLNQFAMIYGNLEFMRKDPIQSSFRKQPVFLLKIRLTEIKLLEKNFWKKIATGMRNLASLKWSAVRGNAKRA